MTGAGRAHRVVMDFLVRAETANGRVLSAEGLRELAVAQHDPKAAGERGPGTVKDADRVGAAHLRSDVKPRCHCRSSTSL